MKKFLLLVIGFLSLQAVQVSATHLMGGQITVRQLSGLDYEISMFNYRDTAGIPISLTAVFHVQDMNSTYDTTYTAYHTGMNPFFNGVEVYEYIDTITLPANGEYRIFWEDCCRNGAIQNMTNPLGESMYFMTQVTVDGAGVNSTPVFLNPPITLAQKFSLFQYNPLPFDADGDSLAWLMETPLSSGGSIVAGFTQPQADVSGPFTLNPLTGELTWVPDSNGHWEASFRVEEYRAGVKIGEIRRDMQFIVVDDTTNWHMMVFNNGGWPQDANHNYYMDLAPTVPFNLTVTVSNPNNDMLDMNVQGEPMVLGHNPSQWNILSNTPGSASGTFSWTPNPSQSRTQPYIVAFRAMDYHNQSVYTTDQTLMLRVRNSIGVNEIENNISAGKVFPNPSNGEWNLTFNLKSSSHINMEVYDIVGQKVAVILDRMMPAGANLVQDRGSKLRSGYYFVNLKVDGNEAASYPLIIK